MYSDNVRCKNGQARELIQINNVTLVPKLWAHGCVCLFIEKLVPVKVCPSSLPVTRYKYNSVPSHLILLL